MKNEELKKQTARVHKLLRSLDRQERLSVVGASIALNDLERKYGENAVALAAVKFLIEKRKL